MDLSLDRVEGRHWAAAAQAPSAIRELSLSIGDGEQVAVIGPSGAGKTTLLQLMAAALKPTRGQLSLAHQNPWALSTASLQQLRGKLFYAPQTPPLPPRQRVITALTAGRLPSLTLLQSIGQLIYPRNPDAAISALNAFDLSEKLWDRVDRLSGGERQRVGLARALMSPATLWLIDEPLSALDPKRARQAIDTLITQARARNVTLVVTLHQVDVATSRFPRVIGLREGGCAFDLPAHQVTQQRLAELYAQHEHELADVAGPRFDLPIEPTAPKIVHCR
ncbi:MAG: ATP-binding cassette domain-containing protein [Betaproteobacteria bacterium]|nr:ATP-binding cassette domain-containing protein [Betaproteobacteria bacterium]